MKEVSAIYEAINSDSQIKNDIESVKDDEEKTHNKIFHSGWFVHTKCRQNIFDYGTLDLTSILEVLEQTQYTNWIAKDVPLTKNSDSLQH